mgnify:CR=1 FL=1
MFILSNFLVGIAKVLDIVLTFYYWLIIIRALISWVNPDPFNPIVQFLQKVTEPVLSPIRRFLPLDLKFGIDIAPLVVILAIILLQSFLVRTLVDLASRLAS